MIAQFQAQVEPAYREIFAALECGDADLAVQSRRYQQVQTQDYFPTDLSRAVRDALLAASQRRET